MALCLPLMSKSNKTTNSAEAKAMFDKVYGLVFGKAGSQLSYKVNIVGIYKTEGHIIYKGKKNYFKDERLESWNDGKNIYRANIKKSEVDVYRADDDNSDKYLSKFKFNADDFSYSYKEKKNYYEITAKVNKSKLMGIKHVTVVVNKKNFYPVSMKIKLAFISTTVNISDFKPGNINDAVFTFPRNRFSSYSFINHD